MGRLGRYVEKWCDWAKAELAHLVWYIDGTVWYALVFLDAGDDWESLYVDFSSDADFNVPKSTSGLYL